MSAGPVSPAIHTFGNSDHCFVTYVDASLPGDQVIFIIREIQGRFGA
jgi:hypothetical protein